MLETLGDVTTGTPRAQGKEPASGGWAALPKAEEVWQQIVQGDCTASHGVNVCCTELVLRAQGILKMFCLPISFSLFFFN